MREETSKRYCIIKLLILLTEPLPLSNKVQISQIFKQKRGVVIALSQPFEFLIGTWKEKQFFFGWRAKYKVETSCYFRICLSRHFKQLVHRGLRMSVHMDELTELIQLVVGCILNCFPNTAPRGFIWQIFMLSRNERPFLKSKFLHRNNSSKKVLLFVILRRIFKQ